MLRRGLIILSWVLAALALGLATANAAFLAISGTGPAAYSLTRCGNGPLAVTYSGTPSGGNYTAVNISAIPVACNGLPIQVGLVSSGGTLLASGSGTAATGSMTLTTGSYTGTSVASVKVLIGTWSVPSTWTGPSSTPGISCVAINNGGNPTGSTCTATITGTTHWISYPGAWGVGTPYEHVFVNFTVATNQNRWQVTFNFADTSVYPGSGFTPTYVGSSYNVIKAPGYLCSSLPIFQAWKAAGNVSGQNNGVLYYTNSGDSQGTTQLCP